MKEGAMVQNPRKRQHCSADVEAIVRILVVLQARVQAGLGV
jgi:hypothetical protein